MTPARRAGWPLAGAAALLAVHGLAAAAAAAPERRVMYYEVAGRTAAELRAALDAVGPKDAGGARWDAYTAWHLRWEFHLREADGACAMDEVETRLRVDVTLPRWEPPADAQRGLARRWRRYAAALETHEAGHEKIARDTEVAVRKAAGRVPPAADCAALEREASAAAQVEVDRAHRAEAEYDRRTRHGARQGARFP